MNKTKIVVMAIAGLFAGLATATEYFVDCNRPDDSGDGLSEQTAKRTIQAAVDLTKEKDIVTVLPGVYGDDQGSRTNPADGTGQAAYRVVVTNQVYLRSRDGAAKTIIKGHFGSGSYNLGTGAIRGVYMRKVNYAAVEGFTITGCASVETTSTGNAHYGSAVAGNWNSYVLGCVLSNNYCVAGTIYTCTAVATLFIGNVSPNAGVIGVNSYFWNCVIANNTSSEAPLSYVRLMANCTVVDHTHGGVGGTPARIYNCVLVGNAKLDGHPSYSSLTNSVTDSPASRFKEVDTRSVCDASRYQLVAPAAGDWRLRSDSDAIGRGGKDGYDAVVNEQKIKYAVSQGYLPQSVQDRYVDRDFAGNEIVVTDGKIDAGAIQGSVQVESGIVVFNGQAIVEGFPIPCRGYSYASKEKWPSIISCKGYNAGKPTFYQENTGPFYSGGKDEYRYPGIDGMVSFGLPPAGNIVTNLSRFANTIVYARPDGDDSAAGDIDHPFRTVKRAVEAASANGSYALVRLLPGVYAEGTTNVYGIANRFFVDNKSMRIESTDGPEATFIVGADSPGSEHLGLGPDAVRCMSWYTKHHDAAVCGITFCGGRTDYRHNDDGNWRGWEVADKNQGGAVFVYRENAGNVHFQDCIFSNNCALISAVSIYGDFQRCRFIKNGVGNSAGSICRTGTFVCCEFTDNDSQEYTLDTTGQNLYFCTVEGRVAAYQANVCGSILVNQGVDSDIIRANNKVYDGNIVPVGYSVTPNAGVTGTTIHYTQSDPSFAAGHGCHVLNCSAAVGGANVENLAALTLKATRDLDGNGLFLRNGYPTAGARQQPMQAVYVKGPYWGVSVAGGDGVVGTNAVAIGESIVVTAFDKARGRAFLGFTVDGVDLPYSGLTYTYTPSDDMTSAVPEIFARYLPGGMTLLLK